jgi:membrane-bound ClpP family serine protease
MVKEIIITAVAGYALFEIIEHVVIPVVWLLKNKGKRSRSVCGVSSMIGNVCEVKEWHVLEGRVCLYGEFWKAKSDCAFLCGDKAVIESVDGLVLRVRRVPTESRSRKESNRNRADG